MEALKLTEALVALVAHESDVVKAAKALSAEWGEEITAAELRSLRKEHQRQFKQIEAEFNEEKERQIAAQARAIAFKASDLERQLLDKVEKALPQMSGMNAGREAAQAAKAIADVKGKSIDKLLSLTGRDPGEKPLVSDDIMKLIAGGVASGVFKLAEGMRIPPEIPKRTDS